MFDLFAVNSLRISGDKVKRNGVRLGVIGVICRFCFGLGINITNPHRPGMKVSPLRVSVSGQFIGQGAAGDKAARAGVSRITIVSRLSGPWFRYTLPPNNTNNTKPDPNSYFLKSNKKGFKI